jgi:choline dehydrogenase
LQRSGIAAPELLGSFGIEVTHALPGVGEALQNHPVILATFAGSSRLAEQIRQFEAEGGWFREDVMNILARSSLCEGPGFDLTLYPMASREAGSWAGNRVSDSGWLLTIAPGVMNSRARGTVRLTGRDPEALPTIDHAFFTDPDDLDLRVLIDGVEIARELARQPELARLLDGELSPRAGLSRDELSDYIRGYATDGYHPVGSCAMGPASDPMAVVDAQGKVHGLDGLYIADASIMPTVPRANTNVPTVVIGEKIAADLLASG